MAPLSSRVSAAVVHPAFRLSFYHRLPWAAQRLLLDSAARFPLPPKGTQIERLTLGGRPAERISNSRTATGQAKAVLYLHGGGYTIGSLTTHRGLAAHLARAGGLTVYLPAYRLAPEHPYPAALDDGIAAYRELVGQHGYTPEQVAIAGDSAGGGLTFATARRLIDDQQLTPRALGAIAPWVDQTEVPAKGDAVLTPVWGQACARAYQAGADPASAGISPLLGELSGLPPTLIQVGEREMLYPQSQRMAGKLTAAGVPNRLSVNGLWHVGHAHASILPEARRAVAELAGFLRDPDPVRQH